jgi:uncharacterized repeat protein (TIGR01451 family)
MRRSSGTTITGETCPEWVDTYTTLTFVAPDGAEYEFYDTIPSSMGRPQPNQGPFNDCDPNPNGFNRGRVFRSVDGTAATFVALADVYDQIGPFGTGPAPIAGEVILRDGTRFHINADGLVEWQRDRNGNKIYYTYDIKKRVVEIRDTLGRFIKVDYKNLKTHPTVAAEVTVGTGNSAPAAPSTHLIRISRAQLSQNLLRDGGSIRTLDQLFDLPPHPADEVLFDPPTVSAVTLPTGHTWRFSYNAHGEVTRVETPAFGRVDYEMRKATASPVAACEIFRYVSERRAFADLGGTQPSEHMAYEDPTGAQPISASRYDGQTGALVSRVDHHFYGSPLSTVCQFGQNVLWLPWTNGLEHRTDTWAAPAGGGALVERQRVMREWTQPALHWVTDQGGAPKNNPRLKRVTTKLSETNQVSEVVNEYDEFNNVIETREYDFGTGAPGALLRKTSTSYYTGPNDNHTYWDNTDIHLRSLPLTVSVFRGTSPTAETQTTFEYDNYASSAFSQPLVSRSFVDDPSTIGFEEQRVHASTEYGPAFTKRGNVTKVTTGLGMTTSTSYRQYDICGNVVRTIGPLGDATDVLYDSAYYYAFPTTITRSGTGVASQTTTADYRFFTGQVAWVRDANLQQTTLTYDAVDRLSYMTGPAGSRANFFYSDASAGSLWFRREVLISGTTYSKATTFLDGLGRTTKVEATDPNGSGLVTTLTKYDGLGRAVLTSNPHRPAAEPTDGWMKTIYDGLDRAVRVEYHSGRAEPTGSATLTGASESDYSAVPTITTTDPSGKRMRSRTDALGRVVEVVEDPTITGYTGLNYSTTYTYDARGNLWQVNQGEQTRYFGYDALGRLARVRNVEEAVNASLPAFSNPVTSNTQWSQAFEYDAAGNVTKKTDARGQATQFTYDVFSRVKTKDYLSVTAAVDATYHYDAVAGGLSSPPSPFAATNLVGRLYAVATADTSETGQTATTLFYGYDAEGRPESFSQFMDGVHYQTRSVFNSAGAITSETYYRGTTQVSSIANAYTAAGSLASVSRNGAMLSSNIAYTPAGALARQQLATSTPLYHSVSYNSRQQPTDIRLGTTSSGSERFGLAYSYGVLASSASAGAAVDASRNNGNVARIVITPGAGQSAIEQVFEYDQLNRLALAKEFPSGGGGGTGADVELVSVVDTPDPVAAGGQITYTVTARNNGPATAPVVELADAFSSSTTYVSATPSAGGTPVEDGDPNRVTYSFSNLLPGQSVTLTVVVAVASGTANGTSLSNTGSVSTTASDPVSTNNTKTATTTVTDQPELERQQLGRDWLQAGAQDRGRRYLVADRHACGRRHELLRYGSVGLDGVLLPRAGDERLG